MNKQRRKALSDLQAEIDQTIGSIQDEARVQTWAEIKGTIDDHHTAAEAIRDEEQEYYDNMPSGLQGGDKGDTAQSAIDNIESAMDKLEEARDTADNDTPDEDELVGMLEEARDSLNEAEA